MAESFILKWYLEANSIGGKTVPKYAVNVGEVLDVLMELIGEMEGEDSVNIVIRNVENYGDHLKPASEMPHDALPKTTDYQFAAWAFAGGVWRQEFLKFKYEAVLFAKERITAGAVAAVRDAMQELVAEERTGFARADVLRFYEHFFESMGVKV